MFFKYENLTLEIFKDNDGRMLTIQVTIENEKINFTNIYSPTKNHANLQKIFLNNLNEHMNSLNIELTLVAGDFNLDLKRDKKLIACRYLNSIMNSFNLENVWSVKKENEDGFTWGHKNKNKALCRIDHIWGNSNLIKRILRATINS